MAYTIDVDGEYWTLAKGVRDVLRNSTKTKLTSWSSDLITVSYLGDLKANSITIQMPIFGNPNLPEVQINVKISIKALYGTETACQEMIETVEDVCSELLHEHRRIGSWSILQGFKGTLNPDRRDTDILHANMVYTYQCLKSPGE